MKVKAISFYLPQFHPIPENDEWWGNGFTEWTNVAATRPRFKGHYQPHIPADLGFYDLRLSDSRISQANLARDYGLYGFCYYHYWFNGKLLLDTPLKSVLSSNEPDYPFCICWANENWTRAWDGLERQVLIKQVYSNDDSIKHMNYILQIIADRRYIRINNKPLILIYRPDIIPKLSEMLAIWREVSIVDFPEGIYLAGVRNGFSKLSDSQYISAGFDALVDFQPNREDFPAPSNFNSFVKATLQRYLPDSIYQRMKLSVTASNIVSYEKMVKLMIEKSWPINYIKFPCVFPSWDNSPRRKSATIIQNDDPKLFSIWLNKAISNVANYDNDEKIVFVNAWNEWAEGCHLEPDKKHGRSFLEAVASALNEQSNPRS